jgi:hypothetical protein
MPWKKNHRIRLVSEAQAEGLARETYEQIKQDLGLPYVSLLHQALAAYPEFFRLHWQAFRPAVSVQEFYALADRLRADAYTRAFSYFEVPDLTAGLDENARNELVETTELLQYQNPLLLLIAAAQLQAFDAPIGQLVQPVHPPERRAYARVPQFRDERYASPFVRQIYEELRNAPGFSPVTYDYCALAQWPKFFVGYSQALKAAISSPIYEGIRNGIRVTAWALGREMPYPVDLTTARLSEAGLGHEDLASIVRLTEVFVDGLSSSVLNAAWAHIALEGGNRRQGIAPETTEDKSGDERAA